MIQIPLFDPDFPQIKSPSIFGEISQDRFKDLMPHLTQIAQIPDYAFNCDAIFVAPSHQFIRCVYEAVNEPQDAYFVGLIESSEALNLMYLNGKIPEIEIAPILDSLVKPVPDIPRPKKRSGSASQWLG